MKPIVFYLALVVAALSCTQNKNPETAETVVPNQADLAEGFVLLEQNCFSCHSPNAAADSRVAPPMEAIKRHYIASNTSQAQFTADVAQFLKNPSAELSKMPGAVEKFNLMPKMDFNDDQINKIAAYIYHTELEKPDWFEKHYQEEKGKYSTNTNASKSALEIGQELAMQTKSVLGKNLLDAINSKGTENAVSFCSTRAIPITDSMAVALNAQIKRVSDKNRNPDNKANAEELAYILSVKEAIANKLPVKPKLISTAEKEIGYYPITTNAMCLQCHGEPNIDITPETHTAIKKAYPSDLAIGYKSDELRGIWVVEMDKK